MKNTTVCVLMLLFSVPLHLALAITTSPVTHSAESTVVAPAVKRLDDFDQLALQCTLSIHPAILAAMIHMEFLYSSYAIGIVSGHLSRQPLFLTESLATIEQLKAKARNFPMRLGQVNCYNLQRHHADYQGIFEPCRDLAVGAGILAECFSRGKVIQKSEPYYGIT